jgi:hypothetical protein
MYMVVETTPTGARKRDYLKMMGIYSTGTGDMKQFMSYESNHKK